LYRKKKKERNACATGFNLKQWVLKRKCWTRDRESLCSSSRVCVIRCSASTSWGIPQRLMALVLSLSSYAGHPLPNTPRRWYGSHCWLPASPSLFHAWWVDSRIRCSRTRYCPEFAREAMTSILCSSSWKGLKNFFVFYFLIVGKVAMIGVKGREWIDAMRYWPGLMICVDVRTHENFLCNTGNVNWSYQSRVILYCDWNLRWCAPSGVRICSSTPAPKELKARKAPSKIKSKRLLKRENYCCTSNLREIDFVRF
jgi:hypothetical protein